MNVKERKIETDEMYLNRNSHLIFDCTSVKNKKKERCCAIIILTSLCFTSFSSM